MVGSESVAQLGQSRSVPTCISCLAGGADKLFAQLVLSPGGQLDAIVPSLDYSDPLGPDGQREFDRLLGSRIPRHEAAVPRVETGTPHFRQPRLVERSELLLAVWDGQPASSSPAPPTLWRMPVSQTCRSSSSGQRDLLVRPPSRNEKPASAISKPSGITRATTLSIGLPTMWCRGLADARARPRCDKLSIRAMRLAPTAG